ncbi:MAG: hypothetical protein OCU22_03835 [Canidatus Methanoxibalbensis ujae]|nr:hypothetical protein [Candidatus Methanoxibalbensis ujae]
MMIERAKREILERMKWSKMPDDAILVHHSYNEERRRYVFEWKRKDSEHERILIWLSDDGKPLKVIVNWKDKPLTAARIPSDVERKARELGGVAKVQRLNKRVWGDDVEEEGYVIITDKAKHLVDEKGKVKKSLIIPYTPSLGISGRTWGPDSWEPGVDPCRSWTPTFSEGLSNFPKMTVFINRDVPVEVKNMDTNEIVTCDNSITYEKFEELLKYPKILFLVAHGAWADFHFVPYTADSHYTAEDIHTLMSDRSKMRLAFIYHCGCCEQYGEGTFEYEYRKGSDTNSIVICTRYTTLYSWIEVINFTNDLIEDLTKRLDDPIYDVYTDWLDTYPFLKGPSEDCDKFTSKDSCEQASCYWYYSYCRDMGAHIDFRGDTSLTMRQIINSDIAYIK